MTAVDVIGWFGTTLYLVNYAYLAFYSRWRRTIYFAANSIAASSLVISSAVLASWQAVGINLFWAVISLWLLTGKGFALIRLSPRVLLVGVLLWWLLALLGAVQHWHVASGFLAWSSTFVFGLAYLLFAAQRLSLRPYHLWNAYAAMAILPQLYLDANWPVLVMEASWFAISVSAYLNQRQPDEPR